MSLRLSKDVSIKGHDPERFDDGRNDDVPLIGSAAHAWLLV